MTIFHLVNVHLINLNDKVIAAAEGGIGYLKVFNFFIRTKVY